MRKKLKGDGKGRRRGNVVSWLLESTARPYRVLNSSSSLFSCFSTTLLSYLKLCLHDLLVSGLHPQLLLLSFLSSHTFYYLFLSELFPVQCQGFGLSPSNLLVLKVNLYSIGPSSHQFRGQICLIIILVFCIFITKILIH